MKKFLLATCLYFVIISTAWSQTGNVGVGTVTPQSKLHVHHTTHGYIRHTNNTTGEGSGNGTTAGAFQKDYYVINAERGNLIYYTDGVRRMFLDSNGNVGIGLSTTLTRMLTVNGMIGVYNLGSHEGDIFATTSSMVIRPKEGNGLCFPDPCPANDLILIPPVSGFASAGGVGIGVSAADAKLHVKAGNSALLYLDGSTPQITFLEEGVAQGFVNNTGYDLKIGTLSANDHGKFIVRTNGSDRMWIDSAGNITMGSYKVAAGYRLSVNGKIMAEEVRVQLDADWPDYVFQNDYRLRPLNELESFIRDNRHLPNIPSATEVAKQGISLGDMQKRLMEKVEELTLYVIQLDKENKELKKEIADLRESDKK